MVLTDSPSILTINGGSSSIKFALFRTNEMHDRLVAGAISGIGTAQAVFSAKALEAQPLERRTLDTSTQESAVRYLVDWLEQNVGLKTVAGVGHRIVHGGKRYSEPQCITPDLVDELRRLSPLDPAHLPGEIALIEAFSARHPNLRQVACFDTAFHRSMPRVARLLPIPRRYESQGIERYGFHGLSYSYLLEELARVAGPDVAKGRLIFAHLGAGASLAAVREGKSVDTSMGFTPTAGLIMGTRSGDLDPGVLVHLMRQEKMTADQLDDLVNKHSGLIGVSETTSDMRDLLLRQANDPRAAEAVALFCYYVKRWIGAFAAALGGLDTLLFSGGIGENAAEIRAQICDGLCFLSIYLDQDRNSANAPVISRDGSPVTLRVMQTDEESMIARLVKQVLNL